MTPKAMCLPAISCSQSPTVSTHSERGMNPKGAMNSVADVTADGEVVAPAVADSKSVSHKTDRK